MDAGICGVSSVLNSFTLHAGKEAGLSIGELPALAALRERHLKVAVEWSILTWLKKKWVLEPNSLGPNPHSTFYWLCDLGLPVPQVSHL